MTTTADTNATPYDISPADVAAANDEHRRRLIEIERQQAAIDAAEAAESDTLAKANAAIQREQQRIAETQSRLESSRLARQRLELEMERTAAAITPDAVDLAVATEVAQSLVQAVDDYRLVGWDAKATTADGKRDIPSLDDRAAALWRAIDRARDRLATLDVSDDAREMVLICEGAIMAAERWELIRSGRLPADESRLGLPTSLGDCPPDNRPTAALFDDVRAKLAGEKPKPFESLGSLVAQRISPDQAALMIGLVLPDGSPCWGTLGQLIDTADRPQPGFRCIRWLGCYDALNTAWSRRQAAVMPRREVSRLNHQASAHGAVRPERATGLTQMPGRLASKLEEHSTWR